jgi:NTE family protein
VGAGMVHSVKLAESFFLRAELYAYSPFYRPVEKDNQEVMVEEGFDHVKFMGMAGLIYNSVLGPFVLRINYLENPKAKVGMSLSFGYLIFNQKSIQ